MDGNEFNPNQTTDHRVLNSEVPSVSGSESFRLAKSQSWEFNSVF